ncbi:hypothetical protein B5X24_HaOG212042 [Helicoverpa armigera]|uniref:EIPR1-like beta-propeller domain-containing protein n=1 Tax=Helicoverpa armigera TaxID=29058 RepID=A0A2W1B895_HELAM|nr:hypothetical protein B5X24_HaOG212042 [Helicoverpa armigera]
MEEGNSIIYGLEHQTRALSPQYGESDAIRFLIGTQSLKPNSNQIHVVELEEDTGALHTKVFKHDIGEVWHLRCSPHDAATLLTTHNSYDPATSQCTMGVSVFKLPTVEVIPKDLDDLSAIQSRNADDMELLLTIKPEVFKHDIGEVWHLRCSPHDAATLLTTHNSYDPATSQCTMGVSVFKLPTVEVIPKDLDDLSAIQSRNADDMELLLTIKPEKPEEEIRCAEWHPTDAKRVGVVCEGGVRVHDVTTGAALSRAAASARLKFTGGKWNPHQGHTQLPPGVWPAFCIQGTTYRARRKIGLVRQYLTVATRILKTHAEA